MNEYRYIPNKCPKCDSEEIEITDRIEIEKRENQTISLVVCVCVRCEHDFIGIETKTKVEV